MLGCAVLYGRNSDPSSPPTTAQAPAGLDPEAAAGAALPAPGGLLVDVSGAVVHPGLYRLNKGERAFAAIAAAGGLAPDADTSKLPNLAGLLKDGEQIKVPFRTGAAGGGGSSTARAAAVDLNLATVEELRAVPGFDPELAQAVIDYRTQYGGFASIRELMTVLGMGEAQYTIARKCLRV